MDQVDPGRCTRHDKIAVQGIEKFGVIEIADRSIRGRYSGHFQTLVRRRFRFSEVHDGKVVMPVL